MSAEVENIIELLGPQELIGQAIQVLMTRDDIGRDAAFELLVRGSCRSRQRVRELAAEIVQQRMTE
jgi:AmiR/NasT family two-component response regulator